MTEISQAGNRATSDAVRGTAIRLDVGAAVRGQERREDRPVRILTTAKMPNGDPTSAILWGDE